jgi:ATP-dependent RNA helicase MSS116
MIHSMIGSSLKKAGALGLNAARRNNNNAARSLILSAEGTIRAVGPSTFTSRSTLHTYRNLTAAATATGFPTVSGSFHDASIRNHGNKQFSSSAVTEDEDEAEVLSTTTIETIETTTTTTSTTATFESLGLSHNTFQSMEHVFQYKEMTKVQHATLPSMLNEKDRDVLARAKTGTGKTLAFLLPVVEHIAAQKASGEHKQGGISAVIVSPTRELAMQIAEEAKKLKKYHEDMSVACFVGGVKVAQDIKFIQHLQRHGRSLDIVVATPGRLLDHLKKNQQNFATSCRSSLQYLVLDEADRLLDMGFRQEIEEIISYLPKKEQRKTLLFSATMPPDLKSMTQLALKKNHIYIDTVDDEDVDTSHLVEQSYVVCPLKDHIKALEAVLQQHMLEERPDDYKIIIFFPTARMTGFMAELFKEAMQNDPKYFNNAGRDVIEMHSRKTQGFRMNAAKRFRNGNRMIMFTSDVSARGVDYPNVSLVVQVGLTTQDQYIHRLGRTARAGTSGKGVLILSDFERPFLDELTQTLPLEADTGIMTQLKNHKINNNAQQEDDMDSSPSSMSPVQELIAGMERRKGNDDGGRDSGRGSYRGRPGAEQTDLKLSAERAYTAFMGFYNASLRDLGIRNRQRLVDLTNEFGQAIGFVNQPPAVDKRTLAKMGISNVSGLRYKDSRGGGGGRYDGNPRNAGNNRNHHQSQSHSGGGYQQRGERRNNFDHDHGTVYRGPQGGGSGGGSDFGVAGRYGYKNNRGGGGSDDRDNNNDEQDRRGAGGRGGPRSGRPSAPNGTRNQSWSQSLRDEYGDF